MPRLIMLLKMTASTIPCQQLSTSICYLLKNGRKNKRLNGRTEVESRRLMNTPNCTSLFERDYFVPLCSNNRKELPYGYKI